MPLKFTKDVSSRLMKYVRTVDITFNPFDARTRSARELLRQVQGQRYRNANPKLVVTSNVVSSSAPPSVVFQFVDGTEKVFDSQDFVCKEMLDDAFLKAMQIDIEYELEGKSIDDA